LTAGRTYENNAVRYRQEPEEDDREHIPLVVRGLDGAPEFDGGLPELLRQVDDAVAVLPRLALPLTTGDPAPALLRHVWSSSRARDATA
jgi:hypothetical protein